MKYPKLETRTADEVTAEAIANLPPELDKSPDGYWPRFIHASIKPFYAAMIFILKDVPKKIHLWLLNRLGIEPLPAVAAGVTLKFYAATSQGAHVPAGTIAKNATGLDAYKFATTEDLTPADFVAGEATVEAVATQPGAAQNKLEADTLTLLESPIPGIDRVTNPASPAGGEDVEPWDTFMERVPSVMRASRGPDGELMAITREDFELIAQMVPGVSRAKTLRCTYFNKSDPDMALGPNYQRGAVAMILVDPHINASPDPAVETAVIKRLTDATVPGVTVTVHHPKIRRVYVQKVEVELEGAHSAASVQSAIKNKLAKSLTAIDRVNENGKSIDHRGWGWGNSLYYNDLVASLSTLNGVKRIGRIWAQASDDSGITWTSPTLLSAIEAGADGADNSDFGLLHWGEDSAYPFEVVPL